MIEANLFLEEYNRFDSATAAIKINVSPASQGYQTSCDIDLTQRRLVNYVIKHISLDGTLQGQNIHLINDQLSCEILELDSSGNMITGESFIHNKLTSYTSSNGIPVPLEYRIAKI